MFGFFGASGRFGPGSGPAIGEPGLGPGGPFGMSGPGFGPGEPSFGMGGPGLAPGGLPFGMGGPGFGPGGPPFGMGGGPSWGILPPPAIIGTAAMLLAGPADAAQVVQRVSEATDGALQPPPEAVELAIGLLAGRGVVTVRDGTATLTELGQNLLNFQGISIETARALLVRFAPFAEAMDFQKELFEFAGLAGVIHRTGTDDQKQQVVDAKASIRAAVKEGRQKLHRTLADS